MQNVVTIDEWDRDPFDLTVKGPKRQSELFRVFEEFLTERMMSDSPVSFVGVVSKVPLTFNLFQEAVDEDFLEALIERFESRGWTTTLSRGATSWGRLYVNQSADRVEAVLRAHPVGPQLMAGLKSREEFDQWVVRRRRLTVERTVRYDFGQDLLDLLIDHDRSVFSSILKRTPAGTPALFVEVYGSVCRKMKAWAK